MAPEPLHRTRLLLGELVLRFCPGAGRVSRLRIVWAYVQGEEVTPATVMHYWQHLLGEHPPPDSDHGPRIAVPGSLAWYASNTLVDWCYVQVAPNLELRPLDGIEWGTTESEASLRRALAPREYAHRPAAPGAEAPPAPPA